MSLTIFELQRSYYNSLSRLRAWLGDASLAGRLTALDRLSIVDAWQREMVEFFERNGHCFVCRRSRERCRCPGEPG